LCEPVSVFESLGLLKNKLMQIRSVEMYVDV
jgi:hypothetical protein